MPVVNASGLIGIVDGVYPHMAKVLLISSPRSRIGGLNLRGIPGRRESSTGWPDRICCWKCGISAGMRTSCPETPL